VAQVVRDPEFNPQYHRKKKNPELWFKKHRIKKKTKN
jgi:hypothetical protein